MFGKVDSTISCLRMGYFSLALVSIFVPFSHQSINYRLPNDSRPYHYKIQLIPHMIGDDFTFEGESKIVLEVFQRTKNLTLNSFKLEFHEESTRLIGEEVLKPQRHILEEEPQFLILNFRHYIEPGEYFLYLKYKGTLNKRPIGFFRDYYFSNDDEEIMLVATQFETTYARMAFPCWDEPAIKATFDIAIKHFPNYTALSNMPLQKKIDETEIDGKVWSKFERTPSISTYLVCFTVSDFRRISNSYGNFSVWSHKETLKYLNHSYQIGMKAFPVLEEYTGIEYDLPKMDVIGVPGLFFGAMENWGLIVVMEYYLLSYNHSTTHEKFITSTIMIHEIAHQWFGNLVTPAWWEDVWITEGLATYMHYFIFGKVMNFPRIMDYFVVANNYKVLNMERYPKSFQAIFRDINSPEETISHLSRVHDKAATVMHMISSLLSEEVFHSGIKKMLQKFKHKTISTDDFWNTMQEAMQDSKMPNNDFDLKMFLEPYISQAGYPVINITRDYATGTIKLTQMLKKTVCKDFDCEEVQQKWWVPINLATSSSLNFSSTFATFWMDPNDEELIIDGIDPKDWYIINIQSAGFYRVNYDEKNWERIIKYMNSPNFTNVHVLNRAKLLDDAYFLFTENRLQKNVLLNLTSYLVREVDYVPWMRADLILKYIWRYRVRTAEDKEFILRLVQPLLDHTGVKEKPGDDFFTHLKRNLGLLWICKVSGRHCDYIEM